MKGGRVNHGRGVEYSALERKFAYGILGAANSAIILMMVTTLLVSFGTDPYADPFYVHVVALALSLGAPIDILVGAKRGYKLPRWISR